MKYRGKLASDIDGVLADTYSVIRSRLIEIYGQDPDPWLKTHHVTLPNIPGSEILDIIHDILCNDQCSIKPYDGAVEALTELSELIGKITFVTARIKKTFGSTVEWLKTHLDGIPFQLVYYPSAIKHEYLTYNDFTCMIEDRIKVVQSMPYITCFLVNRKWNEGRDVGSHVIRVDGLNEVPRKLLEMMFYV